jgi:hypothetical protein
VKIGSVENISLKYFKKTIKPENTKENSNRPSTLVANRSKKSLKK